MNNFFVSVFLAVLLVGQPLNAAEPLNFSNVMGAVQQWRPDSAAITINGKVYEIPERTPILDGSSKDLGRADLKPGVQIMLMIANNKVTHVIINPAQSIPFDIPSR
jgi:hypothetical protein